MGDRGTLEKLVIKAYEAADYSGQPVAEFTAFINPDEITLSYEMEYDGGPNDRERFSRRMIERILTQYGDLGVEFATDDLEYLLAKMNQLPSTMLNE